jgi:hypothetical protein
MATPSGDVNSYLFNIRQWSEWFEDIDSDVGAFSHIGIIGPIPPPRDLGPFYDRGATPRILDPYSPWHQLNPRDGTSIFDPIQGELPTALGGPKTEEIPNIEIFSPGSGISALRIGGDIVQILGAGAAGAAAGCAYRKSLFLDAIIKARQRLTLLDWDLYSLRTKVLAMAVPEDCYDLWLATLNKITALREEVAVLQRVLDGLQTRLEDIPCKSTMEFLFGGNETIFQSVNTQIRVMMPRFEKLQSSIDDINKDVRAIESGECDGRFRKNLKRKGRPAPAP